MNLAETVDFKYKLYLTYKNNVSKSCLNNALKISLVYSFITTQFFTLFLTACSDLKKTTYNTRHFFVLEETNENNISMNREIRGLVSSFF